MTIGNGTQASAGSAGAGSGAGGVPGQPAGGAFGGFATELDDSDHDYGVTFRHPHPEPGVAYPPPPAEEQHAMGLHAQARADERAMRKRNPEMQGTEEADSPRSGRISDQDGEG